MKYALIFAATAAASYDAYGGYVEDVKSSSVTPSTSSKPVGYTTIYPGYNKQPVTVTTQYQPYPTCVSAGYGGESCDKWEDDVYVSTTIKDYNKKDVYITKTTQPVTVYYTKKTITHSATGKYNGYATPTGGYAAPTGSAYKNATEGCWYELYEKIETAQYGQLGPHALPGYPGSGLYKEGETKQPVHVKEYKGGKWSEYDHVYSYGSPQPEVKVYATPGVYTVPAKDVTLPYGTNYPAEATKTAKAGETCTYGGAYIEAKETGKVTGVWAEYVNNTPVVKTTTITVTKTGQYEVCKPTTTVYAQDTEVAYPTAKWYAPGVYHHEAKTVTITKANQAYTCPYEQTKKYHPTATPKGGKEYPSYPVSTSAYDDSYGYKPSATPSPSKPSGEEYPAYPIYPVKSNSSSYAPAYPVYTPVAVSSKPYEAEYGYPSAKSTPTSIYSAKYEEYPAKASSTPCTKDKKPSATPLKPSEYKPDVYEAKPTTTPSPVYSAKYEAYPAKASSTPCTEENKPTPTPYKPAEYKPEPYSAPSPTPVKPAGYEPAYGAPSATPVKPAAYPEESSSYSAPAGKQGTTKTGYTKRGGIIERRQAVAANPAKRTVL